MSNVNGLFCSTKDDEFHGHIIYSSKIWALTNYPLLVLSHVKWSLNWYISLLLTQMPGSVFPLRVFCSALCQCQVFCIFFPHEMVIKPATPFHLITLWNPYSCKPFEVLVKKDNVSVTWTSYQGSRCQQLTAWG
jgi:hypothetical protein